jgi:hypothetical protein
VELSGPIDVDLSGIRIVLVGAGAAVAQGVRREFARFVTSAGQEPFLRCTFAVEGRAGASAAFQPKAMRSELRAESARFVMPEGQASVSAGGDARIDLAAGLGRAEYWTAMNLLRACLAWRLPDRGAALLHAAGVVVDGRAFLLVGPEGSGKSSFARIGAGAGALVVSDDLVLVETAPAGIELLGAPFRSTHVTDVGPGRWPVAALLFPRRAARASWTPAPPLIARARVLANLPFIADAPAEDERPGRLVETLVALVPCLDLGFALDASFVDLLRGGLPARPAPR